MSECETKSRPRINSEKRNGCRWAGRNWDPNGNPANQRMEASAPASLTQRGGEVSTTVTVRALDGRSGVARRMKDTKAAIINDLGGERHVSTMQRILIDQVAGLQIFLEDELRRAIDNGEPTQFYLSSINTLNRLCNSLGLKRIPKSDDIDLKEYLKNFHLNGSEQ